MCREGLEEISHDLLFRVVCLVKSPMSDSNARPLGSKPSTLSTELMGEAGSPEAPQRFNPYDVRP